MLFEVITGWLAIPSVTGPMLLTNCCLDLQGFDQSVVLGLDRTGDEKSCEGVGCGLV